MQKLQNNVALHFFIGNFLVVQLIRFQPLQHPLQISTEKGLHLPLTEKIKKSNLDSQWQEKNVILNKGKPTCPRKVRRTSLHNFTKLQSIATRTVSENQISQNSYNLIKTFSLIFEFFFFFSS